MLEKILYRVGRVVVDLYAGWVLRLDILGHSPLPDGPKIIAANHPTTTDPFLITLLVPEQTSILVSETLFKVPVFGRYLRRSGHIPVISGNGRAAFEEARRCLESGRTVAIFPEGALSPLEGGPARAHTGAARLSMITGAPVIPVGIHLQQERIRFIETRVDGKTETSRWYLRGPYAFTVGQPLYFEGSVEDQEFVRAATESIMYQIARLTRQSASHIQASQALATHPSPRSVKFTRRLSMRAR